MGTHSGATPLIPPAYYVAIIVLVVGRFLFRELRERKLVLARMFLVPGVLGALALFLVATTAVQFPATTMLLAGETLVTLGIGLALGVAVAHFTKVRLGEQAGIVYVLGSGWTVAIWVGALLLRFAARFAISHDNVSAQLAANAALVLMIAAALAMLRYRVLLDARLLRARGITTSVPVI